jgi:tetratricopeptide (TPR) repeat protein
MPKLSQKEPPAPAQWTEAQGLLSPTVFYALVAAVVVGIFAVYHPALNFQFVLDDHHFVNDPRIQTSGHLWDYFTNYVWAQVSGGPASFYRPLFAVWLRLNFIFNGLSSWGWHLLSIAKHVLAAVFLAILVYKLLHNRVAALIAGALFALHPAQTESVAWIAVPDPLMSSAVLGCLLLYLVYVERSDAALRDALEKSRRKSRREARTRSGSATVWWLIASAACCLAALFTKETAIVLPFVISVVAFSFPRRALPAKKADEPREAGLLARLAFAFRESWPFLAVTAVYLLLRWNALSERLGGITQHLGWKTQVLSWPGMLWFYVKVLFWPVRSHAFADPTLVNTFSVRSVMLPALGVVCVLALLGSLFAWAWRKAGRGIDVAADETKHLREALLLGALLLVLPLLLALNLNALDPGDFLHGRYTYLPLCGLMLLLATGWRLMNKGRTALLITAGAIAVAFSVFTVKQEGMWKDDLTVFTVAHQIAPNNAPIMLDLTRAHVQMALSLDEEGRCDEAVPIFNGAIRHYPQDWFAWAGLGECLFKLNDLSGSEKSLRRAAELSHEPRVREEWQMVRQKLGAPASSSQ